MKLAITVGVLVVAGIARAEVTILPGEQVSRLTLLADGCSRDTDCKGARICQANTCVDGPAGMAPSSLAPLPPTPSVSSNQDVLTQMAVYQIQMLQFQKLSLAGPIFTLVIGGAGLIVGAVMLPFAYYLLAVALVIMANAALPLAIGLTWLLVNIGYNVRIDAAIRNIRNSHHLSSYEAAAPEGAPALTLARF
jgi:hypothetical protein